MFINLLIFLPVYTHNTLNFEQNINQNCFNGLLHIWCPQKKEYKRDPMKVVVSKMLLSIGWNFRVDLDIIKFSLLFYSIAYKTFYANEEMMFNYET